MKNKTMNKILLIATSLFASLYSYSQHKKDISWVENNITSKVHIEGERPTNYSILQKMEEYSVPGISIAIAKDGKLVYAKGFGIANSKTGSSVDSNTLFQAASISKPLAALSILKLVEKGKIDLDVDVNTYLKAWKIPENKHTIDEKVTLRRILNHTAGITVHGFPGYKPTDVFPSTIDVLKGKGNTPVITVDTIPGSIWRYSGGGYTIIQQIVKDVSGFELDEYMEKYIFLEIGMIESSFEQPIDESKSKIVSGAYDEKGKLYKGVWHNYPEIAAAGLWTTPSDLIKYCIHIQNIFNRNKEGVLTQETVTEMLTPHKNNWGLGPSLTNDGDSLRFGHGGKNAGFTNNMTAFVHKGDAIVVMTNGDNGRSIIDDVFRAVSTFYAWNIANYVTVNPISIDKKELVKFTGKYSYPENGKRVFLNVKLKNGQLVMKDPAVPDPILLTCLSPSEFIDLDRGITIDFRTNEDGKVIDFLWNKKWVNIKED
ncbi:MAG: CubicO group peptidase (beta-lactamase class C family) [Arenicella sp.]|jgi:CubicO group peptidase (beta-lactamase class C family)